MLPTLPGDYGFLTKAEKTAIGHLDDEGSGSSSPMVPTPVAFSFRVGRTRQAGISPTAYQADRMAVIDDLRSLIPDLVSTRPAEERNLFQPCFFDELEPGETAGITGRPGMGFLRRVSE
jgi:hypothetical protein